MEPWGISGPQFLLLYAVAFFGAVWLRKAIKKALMPGSLSSASVAGLTPYDVAMLAGGTNRCVTTAIARMARLGAIGPSEDGRHLLTTGPLPAQAHPLESALHRTIELGKRAARDLERLQLPAFASITQRLATRGLVLPTDSPQARNICHWASLPLLLVMGVGLVRIGTGFAAGRPVGWLIAMEVISLLVLIGGHASLPEHTPRGEALLRDLHKRNAALGTTVLRRSHDLSVADLTLAVALFGAAVLAGSALAWMQPLLAPPPSTPTESGSGSGSACSGGSSCSSSSCGGGGGCGGGCGG